MIEFLTFQLYGPLVSWGDIAVGEVRRSANYPSKSALIGLLGAALGINRDQEKEQKNLVQAYQFGIKLLSAGSLLQDYHTTQTVTSPKKRPYLTRREALMADAKQVHTILSTREYRCDALSVVAVQTIENPLYSLAAIRDALLAPKYHLYLGRKSCPLALPLRPQLCQAFDVKEALDRADDNRLKLWKKGLKLDAKKQVIYYWEGESVHLKPQFTITRYDQPINRHRWQFSPRDENQQIVTEE